MDLEQTVKDLPTQNSQFQETLLNLAKGQQEMMTLLVMKKKTKKKDVINMGKRFKGPARQVQIEQFSSEEEDNQDEDARSTRVAVGNNQISKDEVYSDEQYPPADDKYKQLKDILKAVEIQVVPNLDFGDLGLVLGVVIPHKFKIPVFAKYDGVSCPKLHLRSYVRKIQPHTADRKLWVQFFQESLSGMQLECIY